MRHGQLLKVFFSSIYGWLQVTITVAVILSHAFCWAGLNVVAY